VAVGGLAHEGKAAIRAMRIGARGRFAVAVRAATALALPLALGVGLGHPAEGAVAAFGALAAHPVQQAPYRYRAAATAALGVGLSLAVLAGEFAASPTWLMMIVAGAMAGPASMVSQAAQLPPPRELMLVMAALVATSIPGSAGQAVRHAGLALAGAALASLVTMSPAMLGRLRCPERRAVADALSSIAALLDAVATPHAAEARHAAVNAVRQARSTVGQARLPSGHPLVRMTVAAQNLLVVALHVEVEATGPVEPGWAAIVRALLPAVSGRPATVQLPAAGAMVGAAPLARAIEDAAAAGGRRPSRCGGRGVPVMAGAAAAVARRGQSALARSALRRTHRDRRRGGDRRRPQPRGQQRLLGRADRGGHAARVQPHGRAPFVRGPLAEFRERRPGRRPTHQDPLGGGHWRAPQVPPG
jgi:hypothetical protein